MGSEAPDIARRLRQSRTRIADELVGTLARFGGRDSAKVFQTPIPSVSEMANVPTANVPGPVPVEIGSPRLKGQLGTDEHARALVIFAHGSGSGRLSPRNNYVAERLRERGIATLLFDLLTPEEGNERQNVFDIPLLAQRLAIATQWAATDPRTNEMHIGYFGASTGAAAALVAAALPELRVEAVVSRGGRPDLAGATLSSVRAPTLLIVGGLDTGVLQLNCAAMNALGGKRGLMVVPEADHLFEEPGTLDQVVVLAGRWFREHLLGVADAA